MSKKINKKIITVLACASLFAALASVSNATTINNNSSATVGAKHVNSGTRYNYSYSVSNVHFSGLPEGAFMTGLRLRADMGNDSDFVCNVNSKLGSGTYSVTNSGSHSFRVYNTSGKNVTITYSFSY